MARPGLLEKDNPVYKWHNSFLEVRLNCFWAVHAALDELAHGYIAVGEALYDKNEGSR